MKVAVRSLSGGFVRATPTLLRLIAAPPPLSSGDPTGDDGSGLVFLSVPPPAFKLRLPDGARRSVRRLYRAKAGLSQRAAPTPESVRAHQAARHQHAIAEDPFARNVSRADIENYELRRANPLVIVNETQRGTCSFPMSLTGSLTGEHALCGEPVFASPSKLSFCSHHLMVALTPNSVSHRLARAELVCDLPDTDTERPDTEGDFRHGIR